LIQGNREQAIEATAAWGAVVLRVGELLRWTEVAERSCFVVPLLMDVLL